MGLAATYASIVLPITMGCSPSPLLIALVTIPLAYKAARLTLKNYDQNTALIPAQGSNVLTILATITLMGTGYIIAAFM